jgi:serine/threonine protein kinase
MGICGSCCSNSLDDDLKQDEKTMKWEVPNDFDIPNDFMKLYKLQPGPLIGTGTTSRVYLVADKFGEKKIACKRIDKRKMVFDMDSDTVLDQLRQETEILRKLDHPSIVKFYDVIESKKAIFIMMEYISGL